MRPALPLIAAVAALLVSCGPHDPLYETDATTLRREWGVALPVAAQSGLREPCSRPGPRGLTGHWMPTRAEIDRLERRLGPRLKTALASAILEGDEPRPAASDYYRQYGGFYRDLRRVVYVNGLHQRIVHMPQAPSWTERPLGTCDGGLLGFGVVYDIEADEFDGVEFDGRYSGPVKRK